MATIEKFYPIITNIHPGEFPDKKVWDAFCFGLFHGNVEVQIDATNGTGDKKRCVLLFESGEDATMFVLKKLEEALETFA